MTGQNWIFPRKFRYLQKQIIVMKSSIFVSLSVVVLMLVSCGKSRTRETSLPDHYLLSSEVLSIERETTNAGALTILHLTLTEEAASRMNVYLQTGLQSATQREISLIGPGERVQMVMTLPVDSRMYSPYWYALPDVIFVPTDSLPTVLTALDKKE